MSNPANYSPYNKTYKFILFQNQAYHQRNKRNISPCVRTNLRHSLSRSAVPRNTDKIDVNSILFSFQQAVRLPVSFLIIKLTVLDFSKNIDKQIALIFQNQKEQFTRMKHLKSLESNKSQTKMLKWSLEYFNQIVKC